VSTGCFSRESISSSSGEGKGGKMNRLNPHLFEEERKERGESVGSSKALVKGKKKNNCAKQHFLGGVMGVEL